MDEFYGDVLLIDTPDGAELKIENGLIVSDKSFRTAVYLSILGGDEEDLGEVKTDKTWWGNFLENEAEEEKLVSRFQAFKKANVLSTKNIQLAEEKLEQDLHWLIDYNIADDLEIAISVVEQNNINIEIKILKNKLLVDKQNYSMQWEDIKNGV